MTRWSLGTLLATTLAGPWLGCDREPFSPPPVTPPAAPPGERAPLEAADRLDGIIVIDAEHRRG
jgi:hypothetical protein